jgi:polyvinyl alcohol dehydrogenase (cytochrome)
VFNVPIANGADGPDSDVGASPNLFTANGRDVVGVGDKAGTYWTLDRDTGDEVWHRTLTNGSRLGGIMVTAATDGKTIYVSSNVGAGDHKTPGSSAITFALRGDDGSIVWQHPVDSTVYGDLTLANGLVFHGTTNGTILALDAATGDTRWSTQPGGDIGGGFSVVDGTLYAGYGFWLFQAGPNPNGGMVAYRLG